MNKKAINKAKQIRRTRKKGCLPFLRSAGVKRRHAYYYSYQKHMDQSPAYYKPMLTKHLSGYACTLIHEAIFNGDCVEKKYENSESNMTNM